MSRTTVNVDRKLLADAREALGTSGVSETVNAALAGIARLTILQRFDVREFAITDEELAEARAERRW